MIGTLLAATQLAATLVVGGLADRPAPEAWAVDAAHTEVNFSVRHFFTPVTGQFGEFDVDFLFDPERPENSSVSAKIAVRSIDTGNDRRDDHLRSGDWFEAETFDYITFESSSVRSVDDGLVVRGELTIKDVTKTIEFPIQILGIQDIPESMQEMIGSTRVASFVGTLELDRRDFGVGVGNWAETAVVGPKVEIELALEAHQQIASDESGSVD